MFDSPQRFKAAKSGEEEGEGKVKVDPKEPEEHA